MSKGRIVLIPMYLSESNDVGYVSDVVKSRIRSLQYFLVENARTARRYISSLQLGLSIEQLVLFEMNKGEEERRVNEALQIALAGSDVGIISEAGLPAVADPGQQLVQKAHLNGLIVETLPGASSMILGVIASGFNGQQYTFHGYLPIDEKQKVSRIRQLEREMNESGYTQVFMETPYRNDKLLNTLLRTLSPETLLFVGKDLTGENEICLTLTVNDWRKKSNKIGKVPTIFAIGKY